MKQRKHEYVVGSVHNTRKILRIYRNENNRLFLTVECIYCGKTSDIIAHYIFDPKLNSCMCRRRKYTSYNSDSRLYHTWANMKYRCEAQTSQGWNAYGAKGIIVCKDWQDFQKFADWSTTHGYNDNMTIDRIDPSGDYSPENCQWISKSQNTARANSGCQHRKADNGKYYGISPDGEMFEFWNANQFSKEHGLNANCVRQTANGNKKTYRGWRFYH